MNQDFKGDDSLIRFRLLYGELRSQRRTQRELNTYDFRLSSSRTCMTLRSSMLREVATEHGIRHDWDLSVTKQRLTLPFGKNSQRNGSPSNSVVNQSQQISIHLTKLLSFLLKQDADVTELRYVNEGVCRDRRLATWQWWWCLQTLISAFFR